MAKILELLQTLAGVVPLIFVLVKQFETPGFGPEKKKAVLDAVTLFVDGLEISDATKTKVKGIAGGLVDIIVVFFNLVGIFKKGNPTLDS